MIELDYNEREFILACIEFIANGNIGLEAIEGYIDLPMDQLYEIKKSLINKL